MQLDLRVLHLNTGLLNIKVSCISSDSALFKTLTGSDILTTMRSLCSYRRSCVDDNIQRASSLWITLAIRVQLLSEDTFQITLNIHLGIFTGESKYA